MANTFRFFLVHNKNEESLKSYFNAHLALIEKGLMKKWKRGVVLDSSSNLLSEDIKALIRSLDLAYSNARDSYPQKLRSCEAIAKHVLIIDPTITHFEFCSDQDLLSTTIIDDNEDFDFVGRIGLDWLKKASKDQIINFATLTQHEYTSELNVDAVKTKIKNFSLIPTCPNHFWGCFKVEAFLSRSHLMTKIIDLFSGKIANNSIVKIIEIYILVFSSLFTMSSASCGSLFLKQADDWTSTHINELGQPTMPAFRNIVKELDSIGLLKPSFEILTSCMNEYSGSKSLDLLLETHEVAELFFSYINSYTSNLVYGLYSTQYNYYYENSEPFKSPRIQKNNGHNMANIVHFDRRSLHSIANIMAISWQDNSIFNQDIVNSILALPAGYWNDVESSEALCG